QNLLSWELSPVASAMEEEVVRWWCRLCGWDGGEGVPVSGGTAANGTALLMALDRVTEGRFRRKGVWALRGQPAVFASDQAHVSIRKAAVAAGLGEESVVPVPSDGRFRLDVDALDQAVRRALTAGRAPVMAVATAGTTSTGSVDPIGDAAKVCRRYGLWLHVDAAHGGAALLSSRARVKLSGIEEADSVTVDPHKWLMQPKGLGLVLTRHVGVLGRLFGSDAPYLARSGHPQGRGGLTFQGSRRFDALRLWMTRLYLGDEGLGQLVERGLALAQAWDRMLRGEKAFESACPPDLNLVCFRYRSGASPEETDRLNERIQRELLYGGSGFVSITTLRGRRWLRSVFINPTTTEEDQAAVLRALEALAKRGTDAQGA
ncbi:MAG: aminotransferase class V-fold PLP-dependent enzyme, partial [Alicyclobacillaceae bacterium]|nr:aminotransferase class V-fold PLP-dependent enzyme [Alicyclobacillaceae bacterium]